MLEVELKLTITPGSGTVALEEKKMVAAIIAAQSKWMSQFVGQ